MPFLKSLFISILASLVSGALLFLLCYGPQARGNSPPSLKNGVQGDGYAVLTLDDSYPDRLIQELLTQGGVKNLIGESSQWVFLDDFGELERIPLDIYPDRVEPFDLRNDGYAEQLRSFFVFQGDRRLFISLRGNFGDLEGRIKAALGDIPFSLSVLTPPRSVLLPGILFIAAAAFALLFSEDLLFTALFLPLWAVLAGLGVPGFALMAVLAGLSRLLREPVREYFVSRRYGKPALGTLASRGTWILSALFLIALGFIAVLGALPPLSVIMGLLFFLAILCLSLWAEAYREAHQGHIRFLPVQITGIARRPSRYSRIMFPFTLAALVLLFLPMFFTGNSTGNSSPAASRVWTGWKGPEAPTAARYREHVEFQRIFSFMPLGEPSQGYLRYSLAEDGLIDSNNSGEIVFEDPMEIPPFPLEGLIDFLTNYAYTDSGFVPPHSGGLICLLIAFSLCIPLIFKDKRGHRMRGIFSMYMNKQIAA
ncbi:hypothetical protein [Treponema primitia]|uniref:hypothetical protein n=1 Tax=Treponema primitia TaxID=88058 RepID=UPI0002554EA3|nr:hypothetical protein [Treponema primitia]